MGTSKPHSQVVGRYAIHEEIASGGMATVHFGRLAGARGFSRIVAIKRLHAEYAEDKSVRAMFVEEARLASRIRHPNVVAAIDIVSDEGRLVLVMEYVPGESLARLASGPVRVPQKIALAIVSDLLRGLHAAHEAKSDTGESLGLVHRDVSPHNVLVGTDGIARVIDFGIARAATRTDATPEGVVKGKLAYLSPEQLAGSAVTRLADVFSASVVLWELLTGKRLFYNEDTQALLIDKLVRGPIERPSHAASGISRILDAITLHGLERDPAKRFQTAGEMAQTIDKFATVATPAEVAFWVQETAHEALAARARQVALIEQRSNKHAHVESTRSSRAGANIVTPMEGSISIVDPREVTKSAAPRFPWLAANRKLVMASLASVGGTLLMALAAHAIGRTPLPVESHATAVVASVTVKRSCPRGMVQIPGGKFVMGSDDPLSGARPAHAVTVDPYCIDVFEVTTEDYRACSDRGDCKRAHQSNEWDGITEGDRRVFDPLCNARAPEDRGKHPINCVEWELARSYCGVNAARLPTEAEWELAARGADGRTYPWGEDAPSGRLLNACGKECVDWGRRNRIDEKPLFLTSDGWATTAPVGSFPAGRSPYGLADVAGNVGEWVADYYAPYAGGPVVDPHGPAAGKERVIRGGAWNGGQPSATRPTFRFKEVPEKRSYGVGFRCAQSL